MVARTTRRSGRILVMAAAGALSMVSCGGATPPGTAREAQATAAAVGSQEVALSGGVTLDGSSTVQPVSTAMAEAFRTVNPGVRIDVRTSGTGGGFKKFCAGGVDIAGASRPINAAESEECRTNRIEYIELPVAFDSLSVVVGARNSFVTCLTVAELRRMWEPAAQGAVTRWNQIRSSFPAQPLALFGPGTESGTFDFFTLAVVGTESQSRSDYVKSEDDTVLVNGVAGDPNALGYFGYAYYLANRDKLKVVAIDNGNGCITPSPEAVENNTYEPLSRPIFVYVSTSSAARPEVTAFVRFYVDPENAGRVHDLGYVPLPTATLLAVSRRLDRGVTGSIFGGHGSVLGVTTDTFRDEDSVKSALVR